MPFLDEIAQRLVEQGAGVLGKTIFLSTKAQLPVNGPPFTVIIEYGGSSSLRTQNDKSIQRPTAQLVSRGDTYPLARSLAEQVYAALGGDDGLFNTTLNDNQGTQTFYQSIKPVQQLFDHGLDEKQRACVGYNIEVEKNPS